MAKDPAFLFYPGDYLRDTQCLSEKAQVAYDRIICEHMRNICISQQQLEFFTKRLNSEEKKELAMVLTKVEGGFQIDWVVDSICKRRSYSESRAKNRKGKKNNISNSYDSHMENENENENCTLLESNNNTVSNGKFNQFPKPDHFNGLPDVKIGSAIELVKITKRVEVDTEDITGLWSVFKIQNLTGKKYYQDEEAVYSHFINWIKGQQISPKSDMRKKTYEDMVREERSKFKPINDQ